MYTFSKRFFPVIHCIAQNKGGAGHALSNARIAFENGADGVFLIGHSLHHSVLLSIYEQVRKQHPDKWIGINLLDVPADKEVALLQNIVSKNRDLNALWMDQLPGDSLLIEGKTELFGGVAFKYINPDLEGKALFDACIKALCLVDTVTTSGSKTGLPPEVDKLRLMREAIGSNNRLALASGVSVTNVGEFLPYVDTFLIASSITKRRLDLGGHEYLVSEKVRELADTIHT